MKRIIKWLYFEYVYPDEVERAEEAQVYVWYPSAPMQKALKEREWIPDDRLH